MKNGLTPIDAALETILGNLPQITNSEQCEISTSVARIVAADLLAPVDVPATDNSAMDGYAVYSADTSGPQNDGLPVSQRITAGSVGDRLERGTVARIFTGAALPIGADAVVMQENCEITDNGVNILQPVEPGENVREKGEDVKKGTTVFQQGHRIRIQDLGTLAACGIPSLDVVRKLKVAVLTTGDELVRPGNHLGPGQIYNSNFYGVAGLLQGIGMEVLDLGIVADTLESTVASLEQAAATADCIISSGGVSVGEEDHVRAAVEQSGQLDLWKLAIKPGKPFAFGNVLGKPFFGLPGNPVSAFVTFVLLVKPALLKIAGANPTEYVSYLLPAGFTIEGGSERQQYLRVSVQIDSSGEKMLHTHSNQSSGVGSSVSSTDGLAVVPPFTSVEQGDMLRFIPFSELVS